MTSQHGRADERTKSFSRNAELETLLRDLNTTLWASEKQTLAHYRLPAFPIILIMGPMRSGTTLFMQWLVETGLFAYPSNLLSRFYMAPIIGAKIQLMLTDPRYNFRDELGEFMRQADFVSENGKTKGALAPNEFWYFWRRFLAEPGRDAWTDDELRHGMDTRTLLAELAGVMDVFAKPFAAKGLLFNYNIPFLDALFPHALFIQIQRDPAANVASVLEARKRQLGTDHAWYSFRIPEYDRLKDLDPVSQAAGQVQFMNQAVTRGLRQIAPGRKLVVQYEEFCRNPGEVFARLVEKLWPKGQTSGGHYTRPDTYRGVDRFLVSSRSDHPESGNIRQALARFEAADVRDSSI